ncbi:MAG TPA: hypothetical protein VF533_12225 [Solirubrobacteraceae bacterium]|jgi:hypothetical protein
MLDLRVYRAAFVPLLLALCVGAFSLERRPAAATTPLAADAFDAARAMVTLEDLASSFPDRRPGSAGEEELAARVAGTLRLNGFQVSRRALRERPAGGTVDAETVVGVRPGVSSRRIVVVADRAALGRRGAAALSGTAALLELSTIFRAAVPKGSDTAPAAGPGRRPARAIGRSLRRTLVLVSTSGATLGGGGPVARVVADAAGAPTGIDAVLVLGDIAAARDAKPWVVPWSDGDGMAPYGLRRSVDAALRAEGAGLPGAPRATAQWARRAFPLTTGAQGELVAAGLPAVLLQASGERGPHPDDALSRARLGAFGRATLRSVTAIDEVRTAGPRAAGAFAGETGGIVTFRRVLPDWAVRLMAGAALLPALLAAFDALFRARRRRLPTGRWLLWAAAGALPFALAYVWLRILGVTGAIPAPAAPTAPGAVPFGGGEAAALASACLAFAGAWFLLRRLHLAPPGDVAAGGAAAALGVVLAVTVAAVWVANPYAAMVLAPAVHLWLLAGTTERLRGTRGLVAVAVGIVPPALVALYYALALKLGPLSLAWLGVLLGAGGHVTPPAAAALSLLGGCLVAALAVVAGRRRLARAGAEAGGPSLRTRGPVSYAGPGSLGGTESALRR